MCEQCEVSHVKYVETTEIDTTFYAKPYLRVHVYALCCRDAFPLLLHQSSLNKDGHFTSYCIRRE
jgi:hypothetical protein